MTQRLVIHSVIFVLCCAAAFWVKAQQKSCLPTPVAPVSADNIFSEEQELFLGEAIAERFQKDYVIIEDTALINYLNAMGQRLLQQCIDFFPEVGIHQWLTNGQAHETARPLLCSTRASP